MSKRFMNKPDYWIDTLEQSYHNWALKVKKIKRELKYLKAMEQTILLIEAKLRDMGVEGFEKSAIN